MPEPRLLGGRYEIDSELGHGGMAEVYLGTDQVLGRQIAVKILSSQYSRDDSFVARFRREAQTAAALNHPNVVSVFDTGSDDGTHYIVLEYIQGKTLGQVIKEDGRLMPERAVEIGESVASGLAFAHRNGIVHRDVKPGNIMLTPTGDVKVMDFGIARAASSAAITQTATVLGTAAYFSPEQAQGEPVDARSDIYSLGCVLYEMVTATAPFVGDSPLAVAYKHVREDPVPPSQLNPDVTPALDAIVLKCMAKNPANRYQTAEDLRADLQRFREGLPVAATPVLPMDQTQYLEREARATNVLPAATVPEAATGRRWVAVAIIVGLVALLGIGLFFLARSLLSNNDTLLEVPDVIGQPVLQAQAQLDRAGFESVVGDPVASSLAANRVVDFTPKEAAEGATITLTVSSGPGAPDLVGVPDVICQPSDEATETLEDEGFEVQEGGEEENPDCPEPGTVARTDPAPDAEVEDGSTVTIFLVPEASPSPSASPTPSLEAPASPSTPDLAPGSDTGESQDDDVTNATSLTFNGTADPGAVVRLFHDGAEVGNTTSDSSGGWTITDPSGLSEGEFEYTAQAENDAGTSDPSSGLSVTVDASPPNTQITDGPESETEDTTATFEFEANEDGGFLCSPDGSGFEECESGQTYDDLEPGDHTFEVQAVDLAGNVDDSPDSRSWTVVEE